MATRLYLRLTLANGVMPTDGEHSAVLPVGTFTNATINDQRRSLLTAKGAAQTSALRNSLAQLAHQDNYLARFTSNPLAAQGLSANNWTIAALFAEGNANSNSFLAVSLYVWRPATAAVVGYIYDSDNALGAEWAVGAASGQVITFAGAAISVQNGDVLVLEIWVHHTQTFAAAYQQAIYYDGATDVVPGAGADAASYLETPQDVNFSVAAPAAEGTRYYLRDVVAADTPTAGEKSTVLPVGTFKQSAQAGFETRSLLTAKGAAQVQFLMNGLAQVAHQDNYLVRFTSLALPQGNFPAGTWTLAIALAEGVASSDAKTVLSLYIWRPSTLAVVGYIYDSDDPLGSEWPASVENGRLYYFSGAAINVAAGDVLVLEFWRHGVQALALGYQQSVWFNGTTDVWWGTGADAASWLEGPALFTPPPELGERVFEIPWSPALIQPPIQGQELAYASFYGPYARVTQLGGRQQRIRILTR